MKKIKTTKKKNISKEVKKPGAQYDCECWKSI